MKIKEVEKRVDLPAANIRYYEKEGLLKPKRDKENNYREYTEDDVRQLEEIKKLRLLGITINDIKSLYKGETSLADVISQRLEQIEEEQKNLEYTRSICRNALENRIDMDSLDDLVLDEKRQEWQQRLAEILREDTSKEVITKKQLNFQIMLLMVWGYLLSTVLTFFLRNIIYSYNTEARERLINGKENYDAYLFYKYNLIQNSLIPFLIALILLSIAVYMTASMKWQLVLFHLSVLLQSPAILLLSYQSETLNQAFYRFLPAMWIMMACYVVVLWMISARWKKFFTKMRYTLFIWLGFVLILLAVNLAVQDNAVAVLVMTAASGVISFFLSAEWTFTNMDALVYNRYDAMVLSSRMINILAFIVAGRGYYGAGNMWRR